MPGGFYNIGIVIPVYFNTESGGVIKVLPRNDLLRLCLPQQYLPIRGSTYKESAIG